MLALLFWYQKTYRSIIIEWLINVSVIKVNIQQHGWLTGPPSSGMFWYKEKDSVYHHQVSCSNGTQLSSRVQLKCEGTRWRTGGEVKGVNWRMEGVASTLHTTSEHGVSSITTADAHTSAASSRLNWSPRRFKWTRPFRHKTKSGFCACAITFQLASTAVFLLQ